jgi:hypothetical protein
MVETEEGNVMISKKKKTSTKWMVLPIPKNPIKLTVQSLLKSLEEHKNKNKDKDKKQPAKKKPTHRTIDDDWTPPW